jgi:hypothetical protein
VLAMISTDIPPLCKLIHVYADKSSPPTSCKWPTAETIFPSKLGVHGFDAIVKDPDSFGGTTSLVEHWFASSQAILISFQPAGRGPEHFLVSLSILIRRFVAHLQERRRS